jgi:ABC-type uncharacterized transport system ATPase component
MYLLRSLAAVVVLAGCVLAQTGRVENLTLQYREVNLSDVLRNPGVYTGQRVTLTAEILSLSADSRSIDLYDGLSRTMVSVSLASIRKAERRALLQAPVLRISVSGLVNLDRGQVVIEAERVEARVADRLTTAL